MKLTRNVLAAGFAVAAISAAACSSQHGSSTGNSGGSAVNLGVNGEHGGNTGSVGMHLNIAGGTIGSLNWIISNGNNTYTGTVNMSDDAGHAAQSIEFVAGPVVAGGGYTVTLSGQDSNGDPCTGTSPTFTVTAGTSVTANTTVVVTCNVPTDASVAATVDSGSVAIDAGVIVTNQAPFQCPGITGVAISPAELNPPQVANLSGGVVAGAGGTQDLLWTATCPTGSPIITNPTSPNATFSCGSAVPAAGQPNIDCTVQLQVGLIGTGADGGSVGEVCSAVANTVITETIACEPGGVTAATCGANQLQCGLTAATCVNNLTDPNNCGTTVANACGNVCSGGTPVCVNGACVAPPPVPCTGGVSPNFTPVGCIPCTGNANGGVCTPEEAAFVTKDIGQGLFSGTTLKSTGGATAESCYVCMNFFQCFDDSIGDTGEECGDVSPTAPTLNSEAGPQACMDLVNCIINTHCDASGAPLDCYCAGTAASTCVTTGPGAPTSSYCQSQETNGLDTTTPATINTSFGNTALAGGMANAAFNCAAANNCSKCFN